MSSTAIVTAGDAKYFSILRGLVLSVRSHPQGADIPIVVLDLGLGDAVCAWLAQHGASWVKPDWDYAFNRPMPEYFKAMVSRPHLPKYAPGFDTLIWLDADTWVQDWSAIDLLLAGARSAGFAIVPEIDRSYTPFYNGAPYAHHLYDWLRQCFDEDTARRLHAYPLLNCGVFAAHRDAPHWRAWADRLADSFGRTVLFISEQTALNVALRSDGLPLSVLPATCNWICFRSPPLCSADGRVLLDPQVPHAPLGIVHLAGYSSDLKEKPHTLATVAGGTVSRPLCFVPG